MNTETIQQYRDRPMAKFQQGDVLLRQIEKPENFESFEKVKGNVVVSSSNPHTVQKGSLYKDSDGTLFLKAMKGATMNHREHKPVKLSPGVYFVEPKVEVDFLSDMTRPVVD